MFSLQEFYAVTGFNCKEAPSINEISDWEDDNGFWSKLLQNKRKINIKTLIKEHLSVVKNWRKVDRIRFVYICVIAGLIMARDEKWTKSGLFIGDYPLVFFTEESFNNFLEWSKKHEVLKIGPRLLGDKMLNRIMGPKIWLGNEDMDAVMYLFRENTSLGRWKQNRVAFMNCLFSVQIRVKYMKYMKNRRGFKWPSFLLAYGRGDLPSHGKTKKLWAMDVDHIYAPVFVNGNHWISVCINLIQRTIEVFDCSSDDNSNHVEPFRIVIPHIVKAVQSTSLRKQLHVTPYSVIKSSIPPNINKSSCDCGVYSLKFIECHLHGLDMYLINDNNIGEARMKIAIDLWKAARDPLLVDRMSKYKPTQFDSDVVEIDCT